MSRNRLSNCLEFIGITTIVIALVFGAVFTPPVLAAAADEDVYRPIEVYRSIDGNSSVESLGKGVYVFRWRPGSYVSPFLVGGDEVVAVDPINREVARFYRDAIASVTSAPITKIIYSHEHLDHIVGADVLAPTASRYAHPNTAKWLAAHHARILPLPTHTINNGDLITAGDRSIEVHYFGPNHGCGNVALSFETDDGRLLSFADTIEIGIAPYRSLPDTNFIGYIRSLEAAAALQPKWVLGGHSGPGPGVWLTNFLNYLLDMKDALAKADEETDRLLPAVGESYIAANERYIGRIVDRAVSLMRPKYGHWRGFEQWAPMNAQTIRMAITIGK
ncbi:MAG TPA: MBL fold metallo-hydrolase [Woeseiaceae bacterium]|nr:MBL fold metallo-hydrolase [Woeseiaceae bacterium]